MSKCAVCGKEGLDTVVACSCCGGISFNYCNECLSSNAEPWGTLVSYISCAGKYPEDINEDYKNIVRCTCKGLGKTEEEFSNAVNKLLM